MSSLDLRPEGSVVDGEVGSDLEGVVLVKLKPPRFKSGSWGACEEDSVGLVDCGRRGVALLFNGGVELKA